MTGTAEATAGPGPLAGFTVAVTAARRRHELADLLARRGARIMSAPAVRVSRAADADEGALRAATEACLAAPLDFVVVSTGMGLRAWMDEANRWGLGDHLSERLTRARLLARGPKARGALRAAGLREAWSPSSESMAEVLAYLRGADLRGRRVGLQLYGEPLPEFVEGLRAVGAEVVEVPPYTLSLPADSTPLRRLIEKAVARRLDAVTFTSAAAVRGLLQVAEEMALGSELPAALRADVVAACVGPVTAAPLERLGVTTVQPHRSRLGPLARELASRLPARRAIPLTVDGHQLELRGHAVTVDGTLHPVGPAPLTVLRTLAARPGRVHSKRELARALGSPADDHAIEMTIARLRQALPEVQPVRTIVKRGYRLADP